MLDGLFVPAGTRGRRRVDAPLPEGLTRSAGPAVAPLAARLAELHRADPRAPRRIVLYQLISLLQERPEATAAPPGGEAGVHPDEAAGLLAAARLRPSLDRRAAGRRRVPGRRAAADAAAPAARPTGPAAASCGRQNMTEPGEPAAAGPLGVRGRPALPPRPAVAAPPPRPERHVRLRRAALVQARRLLSEPTRHGCSDAALLAELAEHLRNPGRSGLANRSRQTWTGIRSDGTARKAGPGRTVPLRSGLGLGGEVRAGVRAR
ncbi:hypothetical protein ABZX74_02440 [Streptomyces olivaceoviridis]|uniref:hypothetical protein n=1 Tax=Streptomyces olivaceoviridis TaxID=1921 RepID=UPI0033BA9D93